MKKLVLFLAVAALSASCGRVREEVVSKYPDGTPELVYLVKGKDADKVRVGEKMFYTNGKLRAEKHFTGRDERPNGTWNYYYDDGKLFAKGSFEENAAFGTDWTFYRPNGENFFTGRCDSVKVVEMGTMTIPGTVYCYAGDSIHVVQFFENFAVRGEGLMVNNFLQGKWQSFYPNGNLMLEAIYIDGKENGIYNSYRENGIPYFRGLYINGLRAGIWEFYDMEGNLSGTKDFDK